MNDGPITNLTELEKYYELRLKYIDGIILRIVSALFFLSIWALIFIILVGWMFD
jgi:hypothetical protein